MLYCLQYENTKTYKNINKKVVRRPPSLKLWGAVSRTLLANFGKRHRSYIYWAVLSLGRSSPSYFLLVSNACLLETSVCCFMMIRSTNYELQEKLNTFTIKRRSFNCLWSLG